MNTEQYQQPGSYSVFEEMENESRLIYATTGQRFLNHLVDFVVYYACVFVVSFILGTLQRITGADLVGFMVDEYGETSFWLYVYCLGIYFTYYAMMEGLAKGRTVGKFVTGTKAMTEEGEVMTMKVALKRTLCRFIPFDALSALGGHPWHDSVSKTMVVKTRNIHA